MSLAFDKLTPVTVSDPRVLPQPPIYPVLKGGKEVLYKSYTTNAVSSSGLSFSCTPPSEKVYVDRKVHLLCPVRLTLTATGMPVGFFILNPHQCCLRSYPLQKALDNVKVTINNAAVSVNIGEIISAMEHINVDRKLRAIDFSKCPTYGACQSQDFTDLFGASRSPMSLYADGQDDLAPQPFPFTIVSQSNDGAGNATSIVDFVSCEPLFLSPLYWGDQDESAFYGVKSMDFTFSFSNQGANRMIAIDNVSNGVGPWTPTSWNATMAFNGFSPAFSYPAQNAPQLLFQYLTPQLADNIMLDRKLNFPYVQVDPYVTDNNAAIGAGVSSTITSNNLQLNSYPSRLIVYIRNNNNTMTANPFRSDTFASITNASFQWENRNGVLASATQQQLYDLSVKNGLSMSWAAWSGLPMNKQALAAAANGFGSTAQQYSGTGSILVLDPCVDFGSDSLDAPGKLKNIMMQATISYKNVSANSITPALYVVAVSQGLFSIVNGTTSTLIGVLTSDDILRSDQDSLPMMISYGDIRKMYGGNFFDSLRSGLSKVWSFLKPVLKTVAPIVSAVPGPVGEVASVLNPVIQGLGHGGAMVSRKKLQARLRK